MAIIRNEGVGRDGILKAINQGSSTLPPLQVKPSTVVPRKPEPIDLTQVLNLPPVTRKQQEGMGGLAGFALKALDLTRTVPSSFLKETFDLFQGEGWSARDFWNQSTSHYGFGDLIRDERDAVATMLALTSPFNMGIGLGLAAAVKSENIWADRIIGGFGDLAVDVLTYVGGVPAILRSLGRAGTIRHLGNYQNRLGDLINLSKRGTPQAADEVAVAFRELGIKNVDDAQVLQTAAREGITAAAEKKSLSGAIRALSKTEEGQRVARHVALEAGVRLRMPGTGAFGRVLRQDRWLDATARATARVLGRDPDKAGLYHRLADAVTPFEKQMFPSDVLLPAVKLMRDQRRFGTAGKAAREAVGELDPALAAVAGRAARAPVEFVAPSLRRGAQAALLANLVARAADAPIRAADRLTPAKLQDRLRPLFFQHGEILKNLYASGDADLILTAAHFEPAFRRSVGREKVLGDIVSHMEEFLNYGQKLGLKIDELNASLMDVMDATQGVFGGVPRTHGFIDYGMGSVQGAEIVAAARAAGPDTSAGLWFDELPVRIKELGDAELFNLLKRLDDWRVEITASMTRNFGVKGETGEYSWGAADDIVATEGMAYSGPRSIRDENVDLIYGRPRVKGEDRTVFDPIHGRREPGAVKPRIYGPGKRVVLNPDSKDEILRQVMERHGNRNFIGTDAEGNLFLRKPVVDGQGIVIGWEAFKPSAPHVVGKSVRRQIDEAWQEVFGRPLYETDFTKAWDAWKTGVGREVRMLSMFEYMEQYLPAIRDEGALRETLKATISESETFLGGIARKTRKAARQDVRNRKSVRKLIENAKRAKSERVVKETERFQNAEEIKKGMRQQQAIQQRLDAIQQRIEEYEEFLRGELSNVSSTHSVSVEDLTDPKTVERFGELSDIRTDQITLLQTIAAEMEHLKQMRQQLKNARDAWEKYVRIEIGDEVEPIVQALRMSLEEAEGAAKEFESAKIAYQNAAWIKNEYAGKLAEVSEQLAETQATFADIGPLIEKEIPLLIDRSRLATAEARAFDTTNIRLQDAVDEAKQARDRGESSIETAEKILRDLEESREVLKGTIGLSEHGKIIKRLQEYNERQKRIVVRLREALIEVRKADSSERYNDLLTAKAKEARSELSKARAEARRWGLNPETIWPPVRVIGDVEDPLSATAGVRYKIDPETGKQIPDPEVEGGARFLDLEEIPEAEILARQRLRMHKALQEYGSVSDKTAVLKERLDVARSENQRAQQKVQSAIKRLNEYEGVPKGPLVRVPHPAEFSTGTGPLGPYAKNIRKIDDRLFAISADGNYGIIRVKIPGEPRTIQGRTLTGSLPEQTVSPRLIADTQTPAQRRLQELDALNKREAYEEAQAVDLPGRSKMTRDELVAALKGIKGDTFEELPLEEMSRAQAVEEARRLGVPGASRMKRSDLISALRSRRQKRLRETTGVARQPDEEVEFLEGTRRARREYAQVHYTEPVSYTDVDLLKPPKPEPYRYLVVENTGRKMDGVPEWRIVTDRDDPLGLWKIGQQLDRDIVGGPPGSKRRQPWRTAKFRFFDEGKKELVEGFDVEGAEAAVGRAARKVEVERAKLKKIEDQMAALDTEKALLLKGQVAARRGVVTRAVRELGDAERILEERKALAVPPEQRIQHLQLKEKQIRQSISDLEAERARLETEFEEAQAVVEPTEPFGPVQFLDDLDGVKNTYLDADIEFDNSMNELTALIDDFQQRIRGMDSTNPAVESMRIIEDQLKRAFFGPVDLKPTRNVDIGPRGGGAGSMKEFDPGLPEGVGYRERKPKSQGGLVYDVTGEGYYNSSTWRVPKGSPIAGGATVRTVYEIDPATGKPFLDPETGKRIPKVDAWGTVREFTPPEETSPVGRLSRWLRIAKQFEQADQILRHEELRLGGRGKTTDSVRAQTRANLDEVNAELRKFGTELGVATTPHGIGRGSITVQELFSRRFKDMTDVEAFGAYRSDSDELLRFQNELLETEGRLAKLKAERERIGEEQVGLAFAEQEALERVAILEAEVLNSEVADFLKEAAVGLDVQVGRVGDATRRLQSALRGAEGRDSVRGTAARQEVLRKQGYKSLEEAAGRMGAIRQDPFDVLPGKKIFELPKAQREQVQDLLKDAMTGPEWGPWRLISGDASFNEEIYNVVNAFAQINDPGKFGRDGTFWKRWDQLQNWLKAGMIATPGFVNRNIFGAFFNAAIDGVNLAEIFTSAKMTKRIARKATSEGTSFIRAAKSLSGSSPEYKRYYQLVEAGVRGGGQAITSIELELGLRNARQMQILFGGKDGKPVRAASYKPWSPTFAPFQAVRSANSWVEDIIRIGVGMDTMKWGGSVEDALERIAKSQFDYDELTSFERNVAKRIMPFYTWTRKNVPYQLTQLGRNPARYNDLLTAKRNLELGTEEEGVVPDYYLEPFGIRLPFAPGGATIYTAPDLPFQDLFRYGGKDGWKGALKQLVAGTTPIVKTPLESYFGKSIYTDIPFTGRYQQVPQPLASLPMRWLMPMLASQGWAKKAPNGEWKMRDHHIYAVTGLVPTFNLIRRMFPNEERYQRSLTRNLLSTLGGISVNFNTPEAQMSWIQSKRFQRAEERRDLRDLATRRR